MKELVVKDLRFEVRCSARRRSLEITVDRGGELILMAPPEVPENRLVDFVQRKRMWVYHQLAKKQALNTAAPLKKFVDGEGIVYLGRSYRLRLVDDVAADAAVKLQNGRFIMPRALVREAPTHLIRWYRARAVAWLQQRVDEYAARMQVNPAGVRVQDLGYRWGSCGKAGEIYFHWKTIRLPGHVAEYVVVHELAHLHERHHTPAFWARVRRAMPDFEIRKAWLKEHGHEVEG